MKQQLLKFFRYEELNRAEARNLLLQMADKNFNEAEAAAFITIFKMRDISIEELLGFRDALLESCLRPSFSHFDSIDLCGTGGDGMNSFNISTLTAIAVASAGYRVIKHGNYGVSSICGSSNVLESMGYCFSNDSDVLEKQLERANICFLHAPLFHPTLKSVAKLRRDLGFRTFFNLLGPLVNPLQPDYQLVGVSDLKVMRIYQYILQQSGRKDFAIVHSIDGFDECALTAPCHINSKAGNEIVTAETFGFSYLDLVELEGGKNIGEAVQIFKNVLKGHGTKAQHSVVAANTALALRLYRPETSLKHLSSEIEYMIERGQLLNTWNKLINI
jgi:anthranilate phosphoribosyltransferase